MGLFDALFGKKPSRTGPSLNRTSHYDLRSDSDRRLQLQAQHSLDGDLENLASLVGRLGHEYQDMGDDKWRQMQDIERKLNDRGGFELMQLVCYRAAKLGGRASSVSAAWNGIGKWRN